MTNRMTTEQLEAIRKRSGDNGEWVMIGYMRHHEESSEFRKHARNDVKALLAEVERLRESLSVIKYVAERPCESVAHASETLWRISENITEVLWND